MATTKKRRRKSSAHGVRLLTKEAIELAGGVGPSGQSHQVPRS
jgi:hypothetical protein